MTARSPLWLSHHEPAHHSRCVRMGGLHVCARCLGTYPVLLAGLALQVALRAPLWLAADGWIALALPLPAAADWARGRLRPESGTNPLRLATGALLGVSLARTLYLHGRRPGHPLAAAQLVFLALFAAGVELACLWRRRRRDPGGASGVERVDRRDREP